MADESLKRLLDAEAKAELIITQADAERQAIIEQARKEVHEAERQHAERVSGIHASFLAQAEQRAQQTIAELKRRHTERSATLQAAAEQHRQQALDAAVALLTGAGKGRP
jgi:V/A-type H+-transporting ATPase subunit G/H